MSQLTKMNVGLIAKGLICAPLWVSQRAGLFAERGLDVSYEVFGSGDGVNAALREDRIQIGLNGPEGALLDRLNGGSLRIVAGISNQLPFKLIGARGRDTIESLRGGRIGVSSMSEGTVHVVQSMLAHNGLDYPADYSFEVVGTHITRWDLLQKGTIDASLQLSPYDYIAIEAGFPNLGAPSDYIPAFAFAVATADARWSSEHPAEIRRFLDGFRAGVDVIYDDPASAIDIVVEETGEKPRFVAKSIEDLTSTGMMPRDLRATRDGLAAVVDAMEPEQTTALFAALTEVLDERYLPGGPIT